MVNVSGYLQYIVWIFLFMESHGYDIKHNILFHDNQSAIQTKNNGNKSCTRNSINIDIRYVFLKDRVDSNNMSITYCSTEHMIVDFFTKYLQGYQFVKLRELIMGWKDMNTLKM